MMQQSCTRPFSLLIFAVASRHCCRFQVGSGDAAASVIKCSASVSAGNHWGLLASLFAGRFANRVYQRARTLLVMSFRHRHARINPGLLLRLGAVKAVYLADLLNDGDDRFRRSSRLGRDLRVERDLATDHHDWTVEL
jgi:hypothetical protein